MTDSTDNSSTSKASKVLPSEDLSLHWWWLKISLGCALIVGVVAQFGFSVELAKFDFPVLLAQAIVTVGVALYVWNFLVVKRANPAMATTENLITSKGLYGLVRHPMYLGDLIYYLGLALLWPSALSLLLYGLAAVALVLQSREEDRWCAAKFASAHGHWRKISKLLIPGIY